MNALIYNRKLQYRTDCPVPEPGEHEALIKITTAGICNTDLEITRGYMGFNGIPGHEFVGVVKESRSKKLRGRRVVGEINLGCGTCPYCRNKMANHCPGRSVLGILNRDGAFAEYTVLPVSNLHLVPDSVSDEEAVFAEPLAAAFEIIEQVSISASHRVCVLGDGKLGLLIAQVLSLTGCTLIAVGRHPEKLAILDSLGIHTVLDSDLRDDEFDIVVDSSGSPSGIGTALTIVKPGGSIILKTTIAEQSQVDLNQLVIKEVSLIGSRCGPFRTALAALQEGGLSITPLISHVFPLAEGVKAFKYAAKRTSLKVILKVD